MKMFLNEQDRTDLAYSIKVSLLEQCCNDPKYFKQNFNDIIKFITEDATYEQLLNLSFNSKRNEKYLPSEVLECVAVWTTLNELSIMIPDNVILEKINASEAIKKQWKRLSIWIKKEKQQAAEKFKKYPGIKKYVKWALIGIPSGVGAAFVYKKFFSNSAKSCKGLVGPAYQKCIKKVKIKAHQSSLIALRQALTNCKQTTNSIKCKQKYQKEIERRKQQINKLR